MTEKVTGIARLKINGSAIACQFEKTVAPGGPIREAVSSDHGVLGHAVTSINPGRVEVKIPLTDKIDIISLQNIRDATITLNYDSGQNYLMRKAGTEGEVTHDGNIASVTLTGNALEAI